MKPLVSICIPAYNAEDFIEEAVHSALGQDYLNTEIIVIDDASTDHTYEKLKRLSDEFKEIRLLRNSTTIGPASNWNKITRLAHGKYVKLLCSDDTIAPSCIKQQVDFLESNPEHKIVTGKREIISKDNRTLISNYGPHVKPGEYLSLDRIEACLAFLKLGTNPFGEPSATLICRSSLIKAGGWSNNWQYAIDIATYLEILNYGKIGVTSDIVSTFRVSKKSWSNKLLGRQLGESMLFAYFAARIANASPLLELSAKFVIVVKTIARIAIFVLA
jgi:glycosyltransferase involved in cell wall biosynthesis